MATYGTIMLPVPRSTLASAYEPGAGEDDVGTGERCVQRTAGAAHGRVQRPAEGDHADREHDHRIGRFAGTRIDQHDARPLGGAGFVAPRVHRDDDRFEIAPAFGQQAFA